MWSAPGFGWGRFFASWPSIGGVRVIDWQSDTRASIDGTRFELTVDHCDWFGSALDRWCVIKPRDTVEHHQRLIRETAAQRILELGIFQGGSTVLYAMLADPVKLVAVDLTTKPVRALDAFAAGTDGRVEICYGIDQADHEALSAVVTRCFDGPLDIVFDDASHDYTATRSSFELLYPMLRPGGCYVIEDWRHPPLQVLAHELLTELADGRYPRLRVERHSIVIER